VLVAVSLLLKNGTLVGHSGRARANLLVSGGRIASITATEPEAEEVLDAEGLVLLPGVIDPHVHFRQPGMGAEDWSSGSRAAAAGGVTTVLDMPNTTPPTTTGPLLAEKEAMVASQSPLVNYGFHFGATEANAAEYGSVGASRSGGGERRVASVKVFMGSSTGSLLVQSEDALAGILGAARLVTVHAEDEAVIRENASRGTHEERRPKAAAVSAISKLKRHAQEGSVYVCHLTSWDEAALAEGFWREATPHHLFLTSSHMGKVGNYAKVNPPLRGEGDRLSLWLALSEGRIDTIGSDHAPHLKEAKESGNPPSGMPGVGTSLPLMLDASSRGLIRLERVAELMSRNPARIFGLRGKGALEVASDADITVVDIRQERKVRPEDLHYKCGWTPYEGFSLRGWPVITIVGGSVAYRDGAFHRAKGAPVNYA
jgi:dihydroorotase